MVNIRLYFSYIRIQIFLEFEFYHDKPQKFALTLNKSYARLCDDIDVDSLRSDRPQVFRSQKKHQV